MSKTVNRMTVQPAERPDPVEPFEVIHLGGEAAVGCPGARSHEDAMTELLGHDQ